MTSDFINKVKHINYQTGEKLDLDRVSTLPDNSMLKVRPDLWCEWDFEKNNELGLDIWNVTKGSAKKVWFICKKCNSNCNATINVKVKGTSCAYCTNQRVNHTNSLASMMPHILKEWDYENNVDISPHDIVCFSDRKVRWKCLICKSSYQSKVHKKTSSNQGCPYCLGLKVNSTNSLATINPQLALQWHPSLNGDLTPHDVTYNSAKVVWWLGECGHEWETKVWSKSKGTGCLYCSSHKLLVGFNDMWTTNPELASLLANPEDGYKYMQNSGKKIKWICNACSTVFDASPNSRISRKCRCPYCSNRKVNITNSLATLNPFLAEQWHPTKNGDLTPNDVVPYTNKKVWWVCDKGHEWESIIASRENGCGCPVCSNKLVLIGYNDLWTVNPKFAELLANIEDGFKYVQQSNKKVDWKCPDCGMLIKQRCINNVYSQGLRCPSCTDYVSFPEKVMTNTLRCFDVKFKYDSATPWSKGKRFDFNIPSLNMIIETHGGQHYEIGFESMDERSLKEVQENDQFKEHIAISNGIDKYIVIDCRRSNFEYIKNNIMKSELVDIFDFNIVDWNEVLLNSNKSFKNQILKDWNSGLKDVKKLAENYSIDKGSVVEFLKEFSSVGLCDYSPQNKLFMLNSKYELIEIFNTVKEATVVFPEVTHEKIRRYTTNRMLLCNYVWILCRTHEISNKIVKIKEGCLFN